MLNIYQYASHCLGPTLMHRECVCDGRTDGKSTVSSLLHVLPPNGWFSPMLSLHQNMFLLPPQCPMSLSSSPVPLGNQSCQFSTSWWVKKWGRQESVDSMGSPLGRARNYNMGAFSANMLVERSMRGIAIPDRETE